MKFININGTRVKALRQAANLTQYELAELLPISKQAISQIESKGDNARIRDNNLQPLAEALRCTAEYLRGETDFINAFKNEDGIWLRKGLIKDTSYKKTGTEYDFLPLENQICITAIFQTIKNLTPDQLTLINELCKVIAQNSIDRK